MASKAAEQEAPETGAEAPQDGPLLDMSDAAVKKMIKDLKSVGCSVCSMDSSRERRAKRTP